MRFNFFSPQVKDNPFSSLMMLVLGVIILSLQDSLIKLMSNEKEYIIENHGLENLFQNYFFFQLIQKLME